MTLTEDTAAGSTTRVLNFTTQNGIVRATGTTAPCIDCGPSAAITYDINGFVASRIDWIGNLTCYTNDARGRETKRIEGLSGTACPPIPQQFKPESRTITTDWHADWRLPVRVVEPLRTTFYTYGAANDPNQGNRGSLLSQCAVTTSDATGGAAPPTTCSGGATRTTTYTYTALGQLATVDGPRNEVTDVVTFTYHALADSAPGRRGNVATITNALGHVTQISTYNAHGQPLEVVDPNGLTTQLAYDSRQRLTARNVGGEVTDYQYDSNGQLTRVDLPDGSSILYAYDTAQRHETVADHLGNRIEYTLDVRGNRTREDIFDPASILAQTRQRVYDSLNRLAQDIGAQNQTTTYNYNNQGNLTSMVDPLNRTTTNGYDALNRLVAMTQPSPGGGQPNPVTGYSYNGQDRMTGVRDPRNLATTYAINGFGDTTQQVSPDTGTITRTFDSAGNLQTSTDARGKVTAYVYDALNRLTSMVYIQAAGAELKTVAYQYDQGPNGVGRLTAAIETSAAGSALNSTAYGYDLKSRLTSETRTLVGNTGPYTTTYAYNQTTGQRTGMTYPGGRTLVYGYDAVGRIAQISTTASAAQGGQTAILVSNVAYHPFGGVKSYTLGNNRLVTRTRDQDGRISQYTLGGTGYAVIYDAASRITGLMDTANAANSNAYTYDNLDRLVLAALPSGGYSYGYDLTGNRTSRGTGSGTSTFLNAGTSNRLNQITGSTPRTFNYDAAGNTLGDGTSSYVYDSRGRMTQATSSVGVTTYQVDAQGRRVRKTNTSPLIGDTVYHYDSAGRLIVETGPDGSTRREYLYLLDIPVGVSVSR